MARRYRPRKLFKFWLYHDLVEDTRLMEYIQYLYKTRQFATMVRNGLRLMWTLGEGDTSVLFELFPTLRSQFAPDNTALLEEFRQMLQAQAALVPQLVQHETAFNGSTKALPAPHVATPVFEDEDTVVIRRDTSGLIDITANFLNAAFAMSGAKSAESLSDKTALMDDDDEPPPPLPKGAMKLQKLG